MRKYIFTLLSLFILMSCTQTAEKNNKFTYKDKLDLIRNFKNDLFNKEIIDFEETLNNLNVFANKKQLDTATYVRSPKATLFINDSLNTFFRVFEDPKGTITAIELFINNKSINVAEYYKNGQVMCKFNVLDSGVRQGPYSCYNIDGTYRLTGYYNNDNEVADSLKQFDKEH